MKILKNTMLLAIIALSINGCGLMIGKENFSCQSSEDLKDAGICGSASFIMKNRKTIGKYSYKGYRKENGNYVKCEEENCQKQIKRNESW